MKLHNIEHPKTKRYKKRLGKGHGTGFGKTSGKGQKAHPHPFFSPDAKMAFFNSDREGKAEIWMVTGYSFP